MTHTINPRATEQRARQRAHRARLPLALLAGLVLAVAGLAWAQPRPLEGLLPSTTVAVFYVGPTAGDLAVLGDALASLDTAGAEATLTRLMRLLDGDEFDLQGDFDLGAMIRDELALECPPIGDVWNDDATRDLFGPGALAVSVSPFNPVPGVIALLRPADPAYAGALQDAIIACEGDGLTFQQDDVTMFVLGDGSDLPLVVARVDDTFVAATDPDLVRGVVRLARGSDEPSHLETQLGAAASAIMDGGLGISVDFGALAAGLRPTAGMFATDPAEEALLERALTALASLGGAAGRLTIDAAGLRFDGFSAPDPSAGDGALAALIACEACSVGRAPFAPSGAVSAGGTYVDLRGIVAYLDGWLAEIGALVGESLDLRTLAAEAGLDLDALLLDWIGERWHVTQLDVRGTDVRDWLVGPGTIASVQVTAETAALAGIALWRDLLEGGDAAGVGMLLDELMFMVDPFGPGASGALPDGGLLAARAAEHRGVSYERWRIGPTTDVGVAVFGGHLVLAMPASAMTAAIDVHMGASSVSDDPALGPALRGVPDGAVAYEVGDVGRSVRALAELSDLLAAPLATAARLAIEEALADPWGDMWGDSWDDDPWGMEPGGVSGLWRSSGRYGSDLLNAVPVVQSLTVPGFARVDITSSDVLPNGDYGLVFELQGLIPGSTVSVAMADVERSWDMDTYLYLYDVGAGAIVADDDDSPDTNRSELVFVVEPGVRYAVVASSWGGNDVGPVELSSEVLAVDDDPFGDAPADEPLDDPSGAEAADAADVPSFAELVALFDVVTDALHIVADRLGVATSITVVEDGVRRTTWTLPVR